MQYDTISYSIVHLISTLKFEPSQDLFEILQLFYICFTHSNRDFAVTKRSPRLTRNKSVCAKINKYAVFCCNQVESLTLFKAMCTTRVYIVHSMLWISIQTVVYLHFQNWQFTFFFSLPNWIGVFFSVSCLTFIANVSNTNNNGKTAVELHIIIIT